jgi:hypothetical protein
MPYKRLLPSQLARLSPGDELIVVVPPSNDINNDSVVSFMNAMNKVMLFGFPHMNIRQQIEQLTSAKRRHELKRNGQTAYEFCIRVVNFPELHSLDKHFNNTSLLDKMWDQGAGYYANVCGYSAGTKMLIKLAWLPHLEFYKIADGNSFLDDGFSYPVSNTNPAKLASSLMENLVLTNGCPIATMEALWKFARQDANILRRVSTSDRKRADAELVRVQEAVNSAKSSPPEHELAALISIELDSTALREFSQTVDGIYERAFCNHYKSFQHTPAMILGPNETPQLYWQMINQFPITHFVIAKIVSNTETIIAVSDIFNATVNVDSAHESDHESDESDTEEQDTSYQESEVVAPLVDANSIGISQLRICAARTKVSFECSHEQSNNCLEASRQVVSRDRRRTHE